MKYFLGIILLVFGFTLQSCSETKQENTTLEITRFDKELMSIETKEELVSFLQENPWYSKSLYRVFPDDTAFISHLFYIISHPGTQTFYKQVDSTYGDLAPLKKELSTAFDNIKEHYPSFVAPKIYTTFTGIENDIYVSDSAVIISLESFLGPKAMYRPDQPSYILRRYDRPYIVPTIVRLLSDTFIKSTPEGSMLNDMVYFGKSFEFTQTMLPEAADSLIIGIPDSSLVGNWYAQDLIWAHFIDKNLLFEQNQKVKEKYLGERPKVPEIGSSCPGRIGQWLGWRIIDKFRTENPSVTFKQLMEMTDIQEILRMSKYRGEVEE
ncbi:gliding motility protein [uncultured Arcticibacterium sp.]|uniref:gliding motility protein GldB-related protein n=1 Tax=uncultured Arcticibacterium sp. TaxID=2173042 RepID=UPI0030F78988